MLWMDFKQHIDSWDQTISFLFPGGGGERKIWTEYVEQYFWRDQQVSLKIMKCVFLTELTE